MTGYIIIITKQIDFAEFLSFNYSGFENQNLSVVKVLSWKFARNLISEILK